MGGFRTSWHATVLVIYFVNTQVDSQLGTVEYLCCALVEQGAICLLMALSDLGIIHHQAVDTSTLGVGHPYILDWLLFPFLEAVFLTGNNSRRLVA